jgi:hypothetical protein
MNENIMGDEIDISDDEAIDVERVTKRSFTEVESDNDSRGSAKRIKNDFPVRRDQEKRSLRDAQLHNDSMNHNNHNISHKRQKPNSHSNENQWSHRQEMGGNFGDYDFDEDDDHVIFEPHGEQSTELNQNIPDYGFINELCDSDFDDDDLKPEY